MDVACIEGITYRNSDKLRHHYSGKVATITALEYRFGTGVYTTRVRYGQRNEKYEEREWQCHATYEIEGKTLKTLAVYLSNVGNHFNPDEPFTPTQHKTERRIIR